MKPSESIPTLSLFSGAGGLDIGFTQGGFDVIACVEIEPAYCATLKANQGDQGLFSASTAIHCTDIRLFNAAEYALGGIECIIGGPPCQTFSAAGRRSGGVLGTSDARGRLFKSYYDTLKALSPKVFLFENVYGLPGANGGGPWREICEAFSSLGYTLSAEVLDAADYGVPQHRERLIIVGVKQGLGTFRFPQPTHGPDSFEGPPLTSVLSAISDLQEPDEPFHQMDGLYGHLLAQVPEGLNYSFFTQEMGYPRPHFAWRSKFHDFLYKVDRSLPARTIKAQPGKFTGPFHWKNRHFTLSELKRLQTFPDNYKITGSFAKAMEQIGNSVPPRLADVLAVSVREQILRPERNLTYPVRPPGFVSTFRQRQRQSTFHFKEVARLEITKRFANIEMMRSRPVSTTRFTVGFEAQFDKVVRKGSFTPKLGEVCFDVSLSTDALHTELHINRLGQNLKTLRKFTITIAGLRKYLLTTDELLCEARIESETDIFNVWDIVEDVLTKDSQFFTLIDIYGHYANRGDTVQIETELGGRKVALARALEFFGKSANCGTFLSTSFVAESLQVEETSLDVILRSLRTLRWDVRSASTHATIMQSGIICTYPFPLLSGRAQFERKTDSLFIA